MNSEKNNDGFNLKKTAHISIDGKMCDIPLYHGSIGPDVIDINNLYKELGVFAYDVGFVSTAACSSSIAYIDGSNGILCYRGRFIEDLATKYDCIDIFWLLLNGDIPSDIEKKHFIDSINAHCCVNKKLLELIDGFSGQCHPMSILSSCVSLIGFCYKKKDILSDLYNDEASFVLSQILIIVSKIYRNAIKKDFIEPDSDIGFMDNLMHMMFGGINDDFFMRDEVKKSIESIIILHAEHGQNASTSVLRAVASTKANIFACISAAIAALSGNAHGGANEHVLKMLRYIDGQSDVKSFINDVKNKKTKLMGFGHRIYKTFDPRGNIIKKECDRVLELLKDDKSNRLLEIAKEIEKIALSDSYFIERNLYPNVDFYSGILLNAIKIPDTVLTCIFALSRSIGWVSHLKEVMELGENKLYRPRQLYKGKVPKKDDN